MDEKGLGRRLQAARQKAGLTQQELCHQAGLSYSTLAKIERGAIKAPSVFTIQNIAQALGTGLDALLGLSPAAPVRAKQVAKNGVRFVYFDINGCLVRFFHAAFTQLAAESQVPVEEVEAGFWHYNDQVCRGDMSMEDFNEAFAKRLRWSESGNKTPFDWQRYYLQAIEPVSEMGELVAWAAERYQVGLFSNIMPGFIEVMRQQRLLPNVNYEVIVDSSQVGAIKPERKIFEIATKQAGVEPAEILLVDDDRPNVMAAERFGWRVLWFDNYRSQEMVDRIRETLQ